MRAASIEKKVADGGSHREATGTMALPHRKPARWASTNAWGWGGASPMKEGGGGVLGHGREGTEGEKERRAVLRPFYRRGGRATSGKGTRGVRAWRGAWKEGDGGGPGPDRRAAS
jgi:hypothetical protein